MEKEETNETINILEKELISKCDKINSLFPKLESQTLQSKDEIVYAFSIIKRINTEFDNLLLINIIENQSNQGMKQLKQIYENIIDQNNKNQVSRLNELLNGLKKIYKRIANTSEEIQKKLSDINEIMEKIDSFQNEISCKTLYKKKI